MKTINAYQTSDGTIFESFEAAERHEKFIDYRAEIEEFIESDLNPYKSIAQRSIARSTVVNWTLWSSKNAK